MGIVFWTRIVLEFLQLARWVRPNIPNKLNNYQVEFDHPLACYDVTIHTPVVNDVSVISSDLGRTESLAGIFRRPHERYGDPLNHDAAC